MERKAYALYCTDEERLSESSSGALYRVLAEYVVSLQGVVFACEWNEGQLKFVKIDRAEDIKKTLGAIYLPAKIGNVYKSVLEELKTGNTVLFSGLPCQCKGLRSFLRKEYDNLIVLSLVCHGVPSPAAYRAYLHDKGIDEVLSMRNKKFGWLNYSWVVKQDGIEKFIPNGDNSFMRGFIKDYYLRPSCYTCNDKYSSGDIVVGDYWGIDKIDASMFNEKGTSIAIINSYIGLNVFEKIADSFIYKEVFDESYKRFNAGFKTAHKDWRRNIFFKKMSSSSDFDALIKYLDYHWSVPLINFIGKIKKRVHFTGESYNYKKKESFPDFYKNKSNCTGCMACYSLCPKGAIRILTDGEGFDYPAIDKDKCIGCKMCIKACPRLKQ